ncbi:MAG: M56 family metallopeptidase [Pseudomonadota bacterium]
MPLSFEQVINALGWTLLHSVWQGLIIGVLFALSKVAVGNATPIVRHSNALGWLLLLMGLPLLTFGSLLFTLPVAESTAAATGYLATWSTSPSSFDGSLMSWVCAFWLAGVAASGWRVAGDWRRLQRQTIANSWSIPALAESFEHVRRAMGIRVPVALVESAAASVPMLVGVVKPLVVIPSSALLGLSVRELELIIAHELAHFRRKDHMINYVLVSAETVLFFHPVVFVLTRTIRHERELCCDDIVISTFNERVCYAHALSKLETLRQHEAPTWRLAATDGPLVTRIARMVTRRRHQRWGFMPAVALRLTAAAVALVALHLAHVSPDETRAAAVTMTDAPSRAVTRLEPIRLAHYPRRPVSADAISNLTFALTAQAQPSPSRSQPRGVSTEKERANELSATGRLALPPTFSAPISNAEMAASERIANRSDRLRASAESGHETVRAATLARGRDALPKHQSATTTATGGSVNEDVTGGLVASSVDMMALHSFDPGAGEFGLSALPAYHTAISPVGRMAAERPAEVITGGALIHSVTPRYPTRARARGYMDKVVVSIQVDATGKVNDVSVLNRDSRPMFQRAVMRAVSKWRFEPLLRNGEPIEQTVEQSFNFQLQPDGRSRGRHSV